MFWDLIAWILCFECLRWSFDFWLLLLVMIWVFQGFSVLMILLIVVAVCGVGSSDLYFGLTLLVAGFLNLMMFVVLVCV